MRDPRADPCAPLIPPALGALDQVHRAVDRVLVATVDEDGRNRLTGPKGLVFPTHELDQVAPCRRVLEDRFDTTRQALQPPDHDRAPLAPERHGVYKPSLSTWGVDRSLEDRRAVVVGANRGVATLRPKLEVAAIGRVEKAPEEWISVVSRPTQPVDGAVSRDEGSRAGVADHRVVANGWLGTVDVSVRLVHERRLAAKGLR